VKKIYRQIRVRREPACTDQINHFRRLRMKKIMVIAVILVMIAGVVFASGSGKGEKKEGYTMGGIVFYSDFFMQTVQAGMKDAADEAGVNITFAVSELDEAKEARIIDDMITKGVDAILITPVSSDGSTAALKRAKEAGVTVVCFNTTVNEPGIVSSFIYTPGDVHGGKTGQEMGKYINKNLGGSAKIGILNCEIYELCVERYVGFMAAIEESGASVEVLSNQQGFVADEAVSVAESVLQAHPDIDMLWSENEGGTVGCVQAVKSMGLQGKVPVFGLDMNPQMGQMLLADDGILLGTTGQSPYEIGYNTLLTAIDVLDGKNVPEVQLAPVLYFGRDDEAGIQEFLDKEGKVYAGESIILDK
jgi:ABC-type sugar transport system substrate-binding protein